MRRIFGIGETVYDILLRDGQPVAASAGGSVFNSLISLGRVGLDCAFISQIGDDYIGTIIEQFLHDNGVHNLQLTRLPGSKTALSLAVLDENNDAHYSFYKDYGGATLNFEIPQITASDVFMYGSYYALNPQIRSAVKPLLEHASSSGAVIYYDLNYRSNHAHECLALAPSILENYALSTIIRGSEDDFNILYQGSDSESIYRNIIQPAGCNTFIVTHGSKSVELFTPSKRIAIPVPKVETVSTIGAGDNFNAGIVTALVNSSISSNTIKADAISEDLWHSILETAAAFGSEACRSTQNYVSKEFAMRYAH